MELADVKKAMAHQTQVVYDGIPYIITACIMRIHNNNWHYQLELKDLKANSCLVIAAMEKVALHQDGR